MKKKIKAYFRLNLLSVILIAISFISVTLAWFAFSGLAKANLEVDVQSWLIEMSRRGETFNREVVISLSEIYPGMETLHENIKIQNLGDSDADIKYSIKSARILGDVSNYYDVETQGLTSEYIEDLLSHNFPFAINMNLTKNYAKSKGDVSFFDVSVSWPLDSNHDEFDSQWGAKAYDFVLDNKDKPSIQIIIDLSAEQYLEIDTSSDMDYALGTEVLFDITTNRGCKPLGGNCILTYVIDTNNTLGDDSVTLLPNPMGTYLNGTYFEYPDLFLNLKNTWASPTRQLTVEDIAKIISLDVSDSFLIRPNLSDAIIGNLKSDSRMSTELDKLTNYNESFYIGYYKFNNNRFGFLSANECYWTSSTYNDDMIFSVRRIDSNYSKVYGNEKATSCKVIPVIEALKTNIKI